MRVYFMSMRAMLYFDPLEPLRSTELESDLEVWSRIRAAQCYDHEDPLCGNSCGLPLWDKTLNNEFKGPNSFF